ncbi:MAG: hypothetical protein NVSMB2_18870 [Chloroflexota bacterium]
MALLGGALLLYLGLRPCLGFAHQVTVAACAWLAHLVIATDVWQGPIGALHVDPIYSGAAIRALGGVDVLGLAVADPIGGWLHAVLPGLFLSPDRVAAHAGVSMVAGPGAPALGRGLASFGADLAWLMLGIAMTWRWRRARPRLAVLGLFVQAQIAINHLLAAHLTIADIDASGIPLALQLAFPNGLWFTTALAGVAQDVRDAVVGLTLVALGYACAVALLALPVALLALSRRIPRHTRQQRVSDLRSKPSAAAPLAHSLAWPTRTVVLTSAALAVATAWSPVGTLAYGASNWQMRSASSSILRAARPLAAATVPAPRMSGPTFVSTPHLPDGSWQYTVDGTPDTIRGLGYNPQYANLPPAERSSLYDRDFAAMRRLGINTIEGWFEAQFDGVTLDSAARNGIGILMPFELNQDWDFTDPNVQQSVLDHVSAYVETYRNHPAVRMWAPGNENLHRILYARWVSQENIPAAQARADAFAAFLPRLVDRIHDLDPHHPVVYRDAEDVYLTRVVTTFAQDGIERPWLVYGTNVYSTPRLRSIVGGWPNQWPGHALLVSEFAPGGAGPAERPLGLQQQWAIIRQSSAQVLGGLAYTWATNGPEDLDRVFGLVDPNGVPTDTALAALSAAYLADSPVTAGLRPGT